MISDRGDDINLKESFFGPSLFMNPADLESYKKNSSSFRSLPISETSQRDIKKKSELESQQHQQLTIMRAKQGFRNHDHQKGSYKMSKMQFLKPDQRGTKEERKSLMKIVDIQLLVERFKDNLFASSYILKSDQSNILMHETYLQEQQGIKKNQVFNPKNKLTRTEKLMDKMMPGKNFPMIIDLISLLVNLATLWVCPIIAAFTESSHQFKGLELFINIFVSLETLITLFRPIIFQGEIINELNQIWAQYVSNQLLEDFLSFNILFMMYFNLNEIIVLNEVIVIIQIIIIIRKIARKYNSQIEYIYLKGFSSNLLDIITLFFVICFYAHVMACLWFYIGNSTSSKGSWLTYYNLQDENIWVKYNYSYYWAVITIVTVGYGDITAKNEVEIAFVSIMVLFSSCMFAYSMNSIGIIVKNIYDQQIKYKRTLILMNKFMRRCSVDQSIQNRIKTYIKFSIDNENFENSDETTKIINDLPSGLKFELEQNIRKNIIQRIKLFTDQFSQQTQNQVAQNLSFVKYTPQDIIYHRDERNDKNLYFISEGEVQVIEENSKKILKQLKAGDTFGEYQFFTGQNTKESTISVGFTELYKIDRDKFQGFIKQNQKDFERFHKIKDVILYQKTFSIISDKCSICQKATHLAIDCPCLTYQPNIYLQICRGNKQVNLRDKLLRSSVKTKQALNQIHILQQTVTEYQENNSLSDIDYDDQCQSGQMSDGTGQLTQIDGVVRMISTESNKKSFQNINAEQYRSKGELQMQKDKEQRATLIGRSKSKIEIECEGAPVKVTQQQKEQKQDQQLDHIPRFEIMRNYSDYLPQNNVSNVVKYSNHNIPRVRLFQKISKVRSFGHSFRMQKNQT